MAEPKAYRFHEIERAPEGPGVYAWYYTHELSDRDIDVCLREVSDCPDQLGRAEVMRGFLDRHLLGYYRETPYEAKLFGPLKPKYSGRLSHEPSASASLVNRLVQDPGRLTSLKPLLKLGVPHFASPIYIGVAVGLRARLLQHKALIEKFLNARDVDEPVLEDESPEDQLAHSFAREVCIHRRFMTFNLTVYVMECSVDESIRIDVENLLNRINYPLCGRN